MAEAESLEKRKERLAAGFTSIFSGKKEETSEKDGGERKENKEFFEFKGGNVAERISNFFRKSPEIFYYAVLLVTIWIGIWIRTRNLPLVRDGYLPADPDSALFLRYMQTIIEQGSLPAMDAMRYVPLGFDTFAESRLLAYFLAYMHKVISFLAPISALRVDMLYPIILFPFIIITFFFLVKKIFDWKIALVASAFLAVMPTFLQRTMLGFSDKEPLGMLLFFLGFYFLVSAWREERLKVAAVYGLLSGIFVGLLGLVWGAVSFAFMIIGLTFLTMLLFGNFKKKDFVVYVAFLAAMTPTLFSSARYSLLGLLTDPSSGIVYFPLITFLIYFVLNSKLKEKYFFKLHHNVSSILLSFAIAIVFLGVLRGFNSLSQLLSQIKLQLLHPFGNLRLTLTVAENQQPFISTWIGSFGYFFWLMIAGAVVLSFLIFADLGKKYRNMLIAASIIFIITLIFSRFESDSIFNGTNTISQVAFFGGMLLFALSLIYACIRTFRTDKEEFEKFSEIDIAFVFTLIWFAWLAIGARGAIRLIFLFSPVVAMLGALFIAKAAEFGLKAKDNILKVGSIVLILILVLFMFNAFFQASKATTTGSFPNLHPQWMVAMDWVKGNTPSDAVFAHWWDYGYWVQTGGERATVLDGGNAFPYWDHLMGRYVLTSPNDAEALEFLYTHNATHFLIDSSDISKYPAYAQIGSDENYDRFSWINGFNLNSDATQETRDGVIFLFQGGTPFDENFVWQGELFERESGNAGIVGFLVPTIQPEASLAFEQPTAILVKNGQRYDVPLKCIHFNDQIFEFNGDGLDGCLSLIPYVDQAGRVIGFQNAIYLSPKVRKSLMARLYILNENNPNFKLIYPIDTPNILDVEGVGRAAPIKIWQIIYPDNIKANLDYLATEYPDVKLSLGRV